MNRSVASAAVGVAVFVVAAGEFAGGYASGHMHDGEDGHRHQDGDGNGETAACGDEDGKGKMALKKFSEVAKTVAGPKCGCAVMKRALTPSPATSRPA